MVEGRVEIKSLYNNMAVARGKTHGGQLGGGGGRFIRQYCEKISHFTSMYRKFRGGGAAAVEANVYTSSPHTGSGQNVRPGSSVDLTWSLVRVPAPPGDLTRRKSDRND